jgi:hypothetical protein
MQKTFLAVAFILSAFFTDSVAAAPTAHEEPLDAQSLNTIKSQFSQLMDLANRHDLKALHDMFWQSPSTLLVAKSALPSEGVPRQNSIWDQPLGNLHQVLTVKSSLIRSGYHFGEAHGKGELEQGAHPAAKRTVSCFPRGILLESSSFLIRDAQTVASIVLVSWL